MQAFGRDIFFCDIWAEASNHISKLLRKGKHNSTIVGWITHELILWILLSVDSLVTMKQKKCVSQLSENWAFLCTIKPILREGKLLWSLLIRTNDRCCKQAECFNSDLRYWSASAANYDVDWGYASSQFAGWVTFSLPSSVLLCAKQFLKLLNCWVKIYYGADKPALHSQLRLGKVQVEKNGLDSSGAPSGCQEVLKGVCLDIK